MSKLIAAISGSAIGALWGFVLWACFIPCTTSMCFNIADGSYIIYRNPFVLPLAMALVICGAALAILLTYSHWFAFAERGFFWLSHELEESNQKEKEKKEE